ncbi:MAG TPA: LLM class flavin-dependent oxidoreductase [Candidatus Limnocylindria bacterium]|nr:LLM class flavin-dependent oxidoreductase [Candidatus Limnocylindria bacterium]
MQFAVGIAGGQVRHDATGIEAIVEQAVAAEALGYHAVFAPDHYVFESLGTLQRDAPAYELFFVLATLAQRTRRIRLGSHVACLLFRHPAMHARLFAQVDEASGGRVIAGVGAGWTAAEFAMMGIPFPPASERLRMLDESVTIMRRLWREERVSFAGAHYRLADAVCLPRPVQPGGPPLMLGGSGPGILRRAGQWADIIHMVPRLGDAGTTTIAEVVQFSDAALPAKLARVRAAEAAAGRAPGSVRFATTIFNYVPTTSPAETRATAERLAGVFGDTPEAVLRHPVSLIGTPEEMRDELVRRERTHGLALLVMSFTTLDQMRAFAEQVIARMPAS